MVMNGYVSVLAKRSCCQNLRRKEPLNSAHPVESNAINPRLSRAMSGMKDGSEEVTKVAVAPG